MFDRRTSYTIPNEIIKQITIWICVIVHLHSIVRFLLEFSLLFSYIHFVLWKEEFGNCFETIESSKANDTHAKRWAHARNTNAIDIFVAIFFSSSLLIQKIKMLMDISENFTAVWNTVLALPTQNGNNTLIDLLVKLSVNLVRTSFDSISNGTCVVDSIRMQRQAITARKSIFQRHNTAHHP